MKFKKILNLLYCSGRAVAAAVLAFSLTLQTPALALAEPVSASSTGSGAVSGSAISGSDSSSGSTSAGTDTPTDTPSPEPTVTPEPSSDPTQTPTETPAITATPTPESTASSSSEKTGADSSSSDKNNSADSEKKPASDDTPSEEALEEAPGSLYKDNASLIAAQHIVSDTLENQSIRFWKVDKDPRFAKDFVNFKESMDDSSKTVASLWKGGTVYVLSVEKDGWLYVESGDGRGFIREDAVTTKEESADVVKSYRKKLESASMSGIRLTAGADRHAVRSVEDFYFYAAADVPAGENAAYYYLLATVKDVVIPKTYALCTAADVGIREGKSSDARLVGLAGKNALLYIIADADDEYVYVESGDVRGFINRKYLHTGDDVNSQVADKGETSFASAVQKVSPSENGALHYTMTSVQEGNQLNPVRKQIVEEAAKYLGHPYVWGGTSLTNGADCSGFVQSLFAKFGYSLPRVAEAQSQSGTQIPVADALPGDLVFYARNGYVYHVALYIGDGKTIEAYGTAYGIIQYTVAQNPDAVWACRILPD
jgi:cell wall-associated NlpC family hydrolase